MLGEMTENVSKIVEVMSSSAAGTANSEENSIENHLRLQESLRRSMEMYGMREKCPEFAVQYLEEEIRSTVEKLRGGGRAHTS